MAHFVSCSSAVATTSTKRPSDSPLNHQPHDPELPEKLAQDLRSLGGVQAPSELWERVRCGLAIGETEQAPEELWDRVQPEVAAYAASIPTRPAGRVLQHPAWGRRLTVAAALMLMFGAGLQFLGPKANSDAPVLASTISAAKRAEFRAKVVVMEVTPSELSPFGRSLAASLGGMEQEDGV